MMIAAPALGLVFLLSSTAPAAAPRLLVQPLAVLDAASPELAAQIEQLLTVEVGKLGDFAVLTRDDLQQALALVEVQQSLGCSLSDGACLAKMSRLEGVDLLLATSLGRVGGAHVLSLTLISPRDAKVLMKATDLIEDEADNSAEVVARLVAELGRRGGTQSPVPATAVLQPDSSVAVMPLRAYGLAEHTAANLTQVTTAAIKEISGASVISQDEIKAMLAFAGDKQAAGCDDAACLAEIGGALGVDWLVVGSAGTVGDTFLVALKLLDIKHARVVSRASESYQGAERELLRASRLAVRALVGGQQDGKGLLRLRANVSDDLSVTLDGEAVPQQDAFEVVAGKHCLRLDAPGHFSQYTETYVEPAAATTLVVNLEAEPRAWYTRWWVWTAVGVALAGGVTTAVLLSGANPDETGGLSMTFERP